MSFSPTPAPSERERDQAGALYTDANVIARYRLLPTRNAGAITLTGIRAAGREPGIPLVFRGSRSVYTYAARPGTRIRAPSVRRPTSRKSCSTRARRTFAA